MPEDRPRQPSPYDVLGVRPDASDRDITRAYRRLARAWHPDARPAGAGAAGRFQAVSDAYELLSDPAQRAAYDERQRRRPVARQHRPTGPAMWPGPVRVEPLPGDPGPVRTDPGWASAQVRLVILAELARAFRPDDRNWPW